MTELAMIDRFLAGKRFALVGVSAQSADFSRAVMRELIQHGYEVVPVNPSLTEPVEGQRPYARVQDVPDALDGAILMTAPAVTPQVVRDCAEAGLLRVWMHRGAGKGAVNADAVRFCKSEAIEVIAGECPLMFLSRTGPHAVHATIRQAFGSYPRGPEAGRASVAPIWAQAFAAWAVSTAALVLMRMAPLAEPVAFWLHALIAPLVFGAAASAYFHRANTASPVRVAVINVLVAGALDLAIVAGVVMRSWALHASVAGAWLPLALIFAATVIVGTRNVARGASIKHA
jgi:predicted CoA-binding protein